MEQGLMKVQMTSPMIQKAFETLDGMKALAQEFLDSQIIPNHFYDKGADGKIDFTKGNVSKVVAVWIKGDQLEMHPMTALQEIVPVNGLLSIKGDGAKALIVRSGKIKPLSWVEKATGSLTDGTYEVTITATRADTGETLSRSFSVELAKRAGLWITEDMLRKADGYKYKASAWYKYPDRMIKYRALGFLARDLFPDVMNGTYTMEEASDFPQDQSIIVEGGGAPAIIQDREFTENRSRQLTAKVANKIDKANGGGMAVTDRDMVPLPRTENVREREDLKMDTAEMQEGPMADNTPEEAPPEDGVEYFEVELNGTVGEIPVYTEEDLKTMELQELHDIIESDSLMIAARDADQQKNTNKKLRTIILSRYNGSLSDMVTDVDFEEPQTNKEPDEEHHKLREAKTDNEDNKFNIEVPETVDGKRSFDQVKSLFEDMANMAGVDNHVFEQLITTKFPQYQFYRTKEDFCYKAPKSDINALLNSI